MGALMKQMSLNGAQIFRPLPLDVDQRPTGGGRSEMRSRQSKIVFLLPDGHTICVQDTPSGSAAVSTETT